MTIKPSIDSTIMTRPFLIGLCYSSSLLFLATAQQSDEVVPSSSSTSGGGGGGGSSYYNGSEEATATGGGGGGGGVSVQTSDSSTASGLSAFSVLLIVLGILLVHFLVAWCVLPKKALATPDIVIDAIGTEEGVVTVSRSVGG